MTIKKLLTLGILSLLCIVSSFSAIKVNELSRKLHSVEQKANETAKRKPVQLELEYSELKPEKIRVRISFYSDYENELEGGKYDKKGKLLSKYNYPVIAMPPDVPYGSVVVIQGIPFTVVDTGEAMKWVSDNECSIDVFIPGKTTEWLNDNTGVFYYDALLYKKQG